MLESVIRAFLVGLCASLPLGPVAILVIQKSLCKGRWSGFVTGLGATFVDTFYSAISIFALVYAQKFFKNNEILLFIAGGAIISAVGVRMILSNPFRRLRDDNYSPVTPADFLQALALAFSNPGEVFVIIALMAFFGVEADPSRAMSVAPVILAVSFGSGFYWFSFSGLISKLKGKLKISTLVMINRIAGVAVSAVGIALCSEGLYKLIF